MKVEEIFECSEQELIDNGYTAPPYKHAAVFHLYEGYANYLRQRYRPKVIIREKSGSLLSPFLKWRKPGDSFSFQLTHCVLMSGKSRNSMMDFDYFSVYGPSSLEYLQQLKWSYGSCKFLYGGSYLFDENFSRNELLATL